MSLLFLSTTMTAWSQDIAVKLDGRLLQFDQPPARIGGRMMVPLRGIFEALKSDVVYDGATRSIQATKGSRVIQLQLGSRTAIIDGRTLFLDVPADTIGGRTMVPLRFVAEALGADVKWDGPNKTVVMSSTGGDSDVGTTPPDNGNTNPPTADGPRIDRVFHSATTTLRPGDALNIQLYGEPGCKATFEILGATKPIALTEVSAGKYQNRWTIPNGLNVQQGVLLAHLEKNGRETAVEADRQVTVDNGSGNSGNNGSTWQESPQENTVTNSTQPLIGLTFPSNIQSNTVRFFVDGVDFSNQARVNGRQVSWQPTYNLSSANHQAEVEAIDTQGQRLTHTWNFRIDPNSSNNNNNGLNFAVQELRPAQGTTVDSRPQIGAVFNQNIQSISLYVDGTIVSNQAGVQSLSNGVLWTPTYNLTNGQHRATVKAISQSGQVLNQDWNFVVGASTISNFTVSPTTANVGQQVNVTLDGPTGATGTFVVGQVSNLALRETSTGRYQGVYTVSSRDTGSAIVSASLRLPNGQVLQQTSANRIYFSSTASPFTVSNLSNGMNISPVFNVQGRATAGQTITVVVTYSSSNIFGSDKTLRAQGVVRNDGSYDVPVDASVIRTGQQFQLTVSDGQQQVQMVLTRN